ncbi:MAG: hypothetical protein BMS9Abin15_0021 [Gammaproteobacteria bacterium]|nr:MAG: hypothetical protein BMS9Abin15_0021 [Gammaproteobacteria bacterium]
MNLCGFATGLDKPLFLIAGFAVDWSRGLKLRGCDGASDYWAGREVHT